MSNEPNQTQLDNLRDVVAALHEGGSGESEAAVVTVGDVRAFVEGLRRAHPPFAEGLLSLPRKDPNEHASPDLSSVSMTTLGDGSVLGFARLQPAR